MPSLSVRLSDNLRLAGALLAAGAWPEHEQAVKAYKPHRVAETARRHLAPHRAHPAVAAAGLDPQPLYAAAAASAWPAGLSEHLPDFCAAAQLEALWAETAPAWAQAESDLSSVLDQADLPAFLTTVFGLLPQPIVVYPNLLYPGRESIAADTPHELLICQPPPPAWGTSPPWRYNERPDEVLAVLATTAAEALFQRLLPLEHAALRPQALTFALAAAVLFLRQAQDPAAGDQFMLMEQKARRLPQLPAVVAALEAAVERGPAGLGEYVAAVVNRTTDDTLGR